MENKSTSVRTIRKTHKKLRKQFSKDQNFTKLWQQHCKNEKELENYAIAMKSLANNVWDVDCDGTDRTKWCRTVCNDYFKHGGLTRLINKDQRRKEYYLKQKASEFLCGSKPINVSAGVEQNDLVEDVDRTQWKDGNKIKLLDVGSCYNPFQKMEEFETTAIDLSPANENVLKCDFLSVPLNNSMAEAPNSIHNDTEDNNKGKVLKILPICHYHVVVFSLLLTYLPCPHQRWKMCEKAHHVLATNGLLLIITPDSSHQNRHAALMKEWQRSIESIGFQRTIYSKDRHLHLMAFRKVPRDFVWDRRKTQCHDEIGGIPQMLNIPQDLREVSSDEDDSP